MSDLPGLCGRPLTRELKASLPDVSTQLVTKNNLPRKSTQPISLSLLHLTQLPGKDRVFDYERCAALHNYILRYAEQTASIRWGLSSVNPTMWYSSIAVSEQFTFNQKLKTETIDFLKVVLHHGQLKFFFGKAGLNTYSDMIASMNYYKAGTFTLYCADRALDRHHHTEQVLFDQHPFRVLVIPDNADRADVRKSRHWRPLEVILSGWIEMIHIGKMTSQYFPIPMVPTGCLQPRSLNQWTSFSFGCRQVDEAADAFARLLKQIHNRMVAGSTVARQHRGVIKPLFDKGILRAARIPEDCFAERFLLKIRAPPDGLLYIAPGIMIPSRQTLSQFQQHLLSPRSSNGIPSIMLFPGDQFTETSRVGEERRQDTDNARGNTEPGSQGMARTVLREVPLPAGVYSAGAKRGEDNAEEGFRFVLPFPLSSRYLKKSDCTLLVDGSRVELYQHGFKACGGHRDRAQRLVSLLENWTMMVRDGHWNVDQHGVAGGIEVFRQAESHRNAPLYRIRACW